MSQEYNENLEEGKLPIDYEKESSNKKLGIILEENNYNISEFEKSKENSKENIDDNKLNQSQKEKENSSLKNSTVKSQTQNNLLMKENDEEKDIKYNTLNTLSDKKILNIFKNITNCNNSFNGEQRKEIDKLMTSKQLNSNESKNKNSKNKDDYNKLNENNSSDISKDIIILSSNKKKSELIKLLSSNKIDSIGNDNITKNINLNININNNIKYEIENNKEKEELENSDLNKSLNSLLKVAEKNCLNLNHSISTNIYKKNRSLINSKLNNIKNNVKKDENLRQSEKFLTLESNKDLDGEIIALSLINKKKIKDNKKQYFKRVNSQNLIKNKKSYINQNNIRKLNIINNKNKTKINKIYDNQLNKSNNIVSFNKDKNDKKTKVNINIYNKKNSSRRHSSIKDNNKSNDIRNLSLNKKENNTKNFFNNSKNGDKKFEKIIKSKINSNNINKIKEKRFGQNNGFLEVNISLNNCLKNEQLDNSLEDRDSNSKIYKRPTCVYKQKSIIKKGKSMDKISNSFLNNDEEIESYRKKINLKNKIMNRTKTNNYYLNNKNKYKQITYIKKNPQIQIKNNIRNKIFPYCFNRNAYFVNKRNYNDKALTKERNSINIFDIRSKSPSENYNYKKYKDIYEMNYYNRAKSINRNIFVLNITDLLILEEKLCEIIIELKNGKKIYNQCFDFWNYYFSFPLYEKLEKAFNNEAEEEIVRLSLNYELMSILLCYSTSINNEIISDCSLYVEILQICHKNLILIFEQILNKIWKENKNNIWIIKLSEIVKYSKNLSKQILYTDRYVTSLIGKINFNTNCLIKKIKNIIYNNNYENKNLLIDFIRNLNQKTYGEINEFFKEYFYKIDNYESSILGFMLSNIFENSEKFAPPYIKRPNLKKYTLVLDLNETLINFKLTKGNQGLVRTRPYLFEFLENVMKYYEIILFTCSTKSYTDSIVKAIEKRKTYFDFIFYREHADVYKNDFVKDLTNIGRPLNSIIIIDNMPQHFRLNKENGIYIKSFWGDNSEDSALYDLIPILINIAKENRDVREGLIKYKDEIAQKVSSNLSKHI